MIQIIKEFPIQFEFPYNYDYLSLIVLNYFGFMFVYLMISPKLSSKFTKSFDKLTNAQKIEWNVRFTSTVFSLIVSTICIYILIVDHAITLSPLMYVIFHYYYYYYYYYYLINIF